MIVDKFKVKSLEKSMILNFSLLIFFIMICQEVAIFFVMQNTAQEINKNYISVNLKQKNEKLNNFFYNVDQISKVIISNKEIQEYLSSGSQKNISINRLCPEINYSLFNTIDGVFLISNNGDISQEAETELGEKVELNIDSIKKLLSATSGEMAMTGCSFLKTEKGISDNYFLVLRKVKSIDTFNDLGILIIAINESKLWERITMEGDAGSLFLASPAGEIISAKDKQMVGHNIYDEYRGAIVKNSLTSSKTSYINKETVLNYTVNNDTGWRIISIVPLKELNSNYARMQKLFLVIGLGAIVIAIYISVIISRNITRPIKELIHSMKKVKKGNLNVQASSEFSKDTIDEVKELNDVFNEMTKELQYLIEEVYKENLREKESQLRALKAQINPHFLYNTLDTIYWMLILKGDEETSLLVTKLGEILRYSIKKGSTSVKVSEEVQQIENYLFIQKTRFEDKLQYDINFSKEIMDYEVLSFLIQPFIENAINHGIMDGKGYGKIAIRGYKKENSIYFEVEDDGTGMPQELVENYNQHEPESVAKHSGIGIENVNERIRFYYGNEYGATIESVENAGTKIVIKLPIEGQGGDTK
jgi:two-component system, sensor histidine kinase YesM